MPFDVVLALVSAVSSISLCWLVFSVLTDGIGWFGFWLVAYVVFLAIYFVVTYDRVGRLAAVDRLFTVAVWSAMIVVLVPLVWLIVYILAKGSAGAVAGLLRPHPEGHHPDPAGHRRRRPARHRGHHRAGGHRPIDFAARWG